MMMVVMMARLLWGTAQYVSRYPKEREEQGDGDGNKGGDDGLHIWKWDENTSQSVWELYWNQDQKMKMKKEEMSQGRILKKENSR